MSGHSKWSSIKHKKGAADAKRGKLFSKLARAIIVAARDGGGDTEGNPTLATAVQKARDASMPKDKHPAGDRHAAPAPAPTGRRSNGSSTRATGPAAWRSWSRR